MNGLQERLSENELRKYSLLTEAASLYYEKNMTQAEIADRLCISRSRISRLLTRARELGIVQIRINRFLERNYAVEELLCQRFGLKQALVFDSARHDAESALQGTVELAARCLNELIDRKMTVGISVGHVVAKTIQAIRPAGAFSVDVVQIMGYAGYAFNEEDEPDYNAMSSMLAAKYGGAAHYLNAPLYVSDPATKEQLLSDPAVSHTLALALNADLILTGIGTLNDFLQSNPWTGYMIPQMRAALKKQGAVGCIGARFFDRDGRILSNEWNENCIGLKLEDIRRMETVVAVASGPDKTEAIRAALNGRLINVLITDYATVESLFRPRLQEA